MLYSCTHVAIVGVNGLTFQPNVWLVNAPGGTAAAAPPPFRPSEPALCGSCPLVTPYYCRLGDLCFAFIVRLVYFSVIDVLYVSLQYFDAVGWVF